MRAWRPVACPVPLPGLAVSPTRRQLPVRGAADRPGIGLGVRHGGSAPLWVGESSHPPEVTGVPVHGRHARHQRTASRQDARWQAEVMGSVDAVLSGCGSAALGCWGDQTAVDQLQAGRRGRPTWRPCPPSTVRAAHPGDQHSGLASGRRLDPHVPGRTYVTFARRGVHRRQAFAERSELGASPRRHKTQGRHRLRHSRRRTTRSGSLSAFWTNDGFSPTEEDLPPSPGVGGRR